VIYLDEETMLPINIETYYLDLELANANNDATQWQVLHDYLSYYRLKDMSPSSMLDLSEKIFKYE
jgi:hypothetical protein